MIHLHNGNLSPAIKMRLRIMLSIAFDLMPDVAAHLAFPLALRAGPSSTREKHEDAVMKGIWEPHHPVLLGTTGTLSNMGESGRRQPW
jgi:hypothetical protein